MQKKLLYRSLAACVPGLAFVHGPVAIESGATTATFQNFITRQGDKLMDGESEFLFVKTLDHLLAEANR